MEEIEVKDNPLGIKVYAVGRPDIELMPEEEFGLFVSSLELRVSEYFEKLNESKLEAYGRRRIATSSGCRKDSVCRKERKNKQPHPPKKR